MRDLAVVSILGNPVINRLRATSGNPEGATTLPSQAGRVYAPYDSRLPWYLGLLIGLMSKEKVEKSSESVDRHIGGIVIAWLDGHSAYLQFLCTFKLVSHLHFVSQLLVKFMRKNQRKNAPTHVREVCIYYIE